VLDTTDLAKLRGKPMPHYVDALRRHLALDAAAVTQAPQGQGGPLRGKQY
jgi:hypothetical protein